jgi:hypothetical protein
MPPILATTVRTAAAPRFIPAPAVAIAIATLAIGVTPALMPSGCVSWKGGGDRWLAVNARALPGRRDVLVDGWHCNQRGTTRTVILVGTPALWHAIALFPQPTHGPLSQGCAVADGNSKGR